LFSEEKTGKYFKYVFCQVICCFRNSNCITNE